MKLTRRKLATVLVSATDRKSTRLNSSHRCISYAVFCLKKNKKAYVDDKAGCGNRASPPPLGSPTPNPPNAPVLPAADARTTNCPVMDLRDFFFLGNGTPPKSPLFPSGPLFG